MVDAPRSALRCIAIAVEGPRMADPYARMFCRRLGSWNDCFLLEVREDATGMKYTDRTFADLRADTIDPTTFLHTIAVAKTADSYAATREGGKSRQAFM
ncbi:hypothetical protein LTR17_005576 [Elasticomyces elasticus]|nr:hypothetical protein LTR17_005576 [Elasticomyces elasticus]